MLTRIILNVKNGIYYFAEGITEQEYVDIMAAHNNRKETPTIEVNKQIRKLGAIMSIGASNLQPSQSVMGTVLVPPIKVNKGEVYFEYKQNAISRRFNMATRNYDITEIDCNKGTTRAGVHKVVKGCYWVNSCQPCVKTQEESWATVVKLLNAPAIMIYKRSETDYCLEQLEIIANEAEAKRIAKLEQEIDDYER